jgi:hypothetical protein
MTPADLPPDVALVGGWMIRVSSGGVSDTPPLNPLIQEPLRSLRHLPCRSLRLHAESQLSPCASLISVAFSISSGSLARRASFRLAAPLGLRLTCTPRAQIRKMSRLPFRSLAPRTHTAARARSPRFHKRPRILDTRLPKRKRRFPQIIRRGLSHPPTYQKNPGTKK